MPTELDEISHKIMQLEIEEAALKKETDKLSIGHREDIEAELSALREKFNSMKAKWDNEKTEIGKVQKIRSEIENINAQIESAQNKYDLAKAAELKYGKLLELEKKLTEIQHKEKTSGSEKNQLLKEEIDELLLDVQFIPPMPKVIKEGDL